jgi:hypothetical protein
MADQENQVKLSQNKAQAISMKASLEQEKVDLSTTSLKSNSPAPVQAKEAVVDRNLSKVNQTIKQIERLQVKVANGQVTAQGRNIARDTTARAAQRGNRALETKKQQQQVLQKKVEARREAKAKQNERIDRRAQRRLQRKHEAKLQTERVARVEAQDVIKETLLQRTMNMLTRAITAKSEVKTTTATASDVEAAKLAQKLTEVGKRESSDRLKSAIRPEDNQEEGDADFDINDDAGAFSGVLESQDKSSAAADGMSADEIFMIEQQAVAAQLAGEVNLSEEYIKFFLDLLSFPEVQKLLQERLSLEAAAIMRAVLFQLIEKLAAAGVDPSLSKLLSSVNSGEFPVTTNQVSELMNLLSQQVQRVDVQQVLREIDTMDDVDERTVPMYRSKPAEEYLQKETDAAAEEANKEAQVP